VDPVKQKQGCLCLDFSFSLDLWSLPVLWGVKKKPVYVGGVEKHRWRFLRKWLSSYASAGAGLAAGFVAAFRPAGFFAVSFFLPAAFPLGLGAALALGAALGFAAALAFAGMFGEAVKISIELRVVCVQKLHVKDFPERKN